MVPLSRSQAGPGHGKGSADTPEGLEDSHSERTTLTLPALKPVLTQLCLLIGLFSLLAPRFLASAQEQTTEPVDSLALTKRMVALQQSGRHAEALPIALQVLRTAEEELGPWHPTVAIYLDNLGVLYHALGDVEKSEAAFRRAWVIQEATLGADSMAVSTTLNHMAALYHTRGQDSQAKALLERAVGMRERHLGPEHPATVTVLSHLAVLYEAAGEYDEAEPLFQRILLIQEHTAGPFHPTTARTLESYARLLRNTDRPDEAAAVEARVQALNANRTSGNSSR